MKTLQRTRLILAAAALLLMPLASSAEISISVDLAPPAFPVYEQPPAPAPDYIWAPGYWAYGDVDGYYWVPGTWVLSPTPGYLWTPCYWGWSGGRYVYHDGYWGPHVGFYGGINYGYGYGGHGYEGGGWNNGTFVNRSYSNQTNVTNVTNVTSFNGGPGGTTAAPTSAERAAANEPHVPPTSQQQAHVQAASQNPAMRASVNHGKPAVAATARPGEFSGKGVVAAKQAGAVPNAQTSKSQPNKGEARPQEHPAQTNNPPAHAAQANPARNQAAQPDSQSRSAHPTPQTVSKRPQTPPKPKARPKPRSNPKPKH